MANEWPAGQRTLQIALERIDDIASRIRDRVQLVRTNSAAGTATRTDILALKSQLKLAEDNWQAVIAGVNNADLKTYMLTQKTGLDPAYDPQASYLQMRNAATALRTWIHNNMPVDAGSGAILEYVSNLDGGITPLTVPAANALSVQFRAEADSFLATIV